MKRVLLGVVVLLSLGSIGSAVFIFAQRSMQPPAEAPSEWDVKYISPRDASPLPIQVREEPADPSANNPFAQGRTPASDPYQSQGEIASDNRQAPRNARWDDTQFIPDAAEADLAVTSSANRAARYAQPTASDDFSARDTSPSANEPPSRNEMPSNRTTEPFAARQPSRANPRYAEQTVAAEMEIEPAAPARDPFAETQIPRQFEAGPAEQVDRHGNRPAPQRTLARDVPDDAPWGNRSTDDTRPPSVAPPLDAWPTRGPQSDSDEGTGRPGDPRLSGSQAPTITIEKVAPSEIQIGKPARFLIKVRNTGAVTAQGVEIHDTIPQGTQMIDARPPAQRGANGTLVWELGAMKPGEEATAELQLMPLAEGEVGSVATVHFRAEASVRTIATKPMLTMEVQGPAKVMKGDEVTLKIKLTNPGSGTATGVILTEEVPRGLAHPAGQELELEVGTLKPGESRVLELGLKAVEAGVVTNVITAQGEASLRAEATNDLEVVAPQLSVNLAGPKRRYLERNATHNISISNPGTASAREIELVAVLPRELKFVEANNGGQFDPATHSVYWSLEELPPQETGTVQLVTLPMAAGEAKLMIKSTAHGGLVDQREEVLAIEGMAALNFHVSDVNDPIEVGGQTSYEIRITNQGSKAATNIRLAALLPREMRGLSAEGPVRYRIEGQRIVFEPLKQLAPKADTVFTIKTQAVEPGDLRIQVQIATDEIREPITKEESTRVFGDD